MFRIERNGAIARLLLDRPAARNAIPATGWAALAGQLDTVAESDARLLVVSGAGGAFCAGADLADFAAMRGDAAAVAPLPRGDARRARPAARAAIPTIAPVEGHCYGAGVALAMACDLRVARRPPNSRSRRRRSASPIRRRTCTGWSTLVGPGQAARMLFTAETIPARRRCGSASSSSGRGPEAELAAILANDPESLATLKQAIAQAAEGMRSDAEQDRRFDALIGGDEMARRLEALRRK